MHSQPSATPFALTRGQPLVVTAATGYPIVDLLRDAGFTIDQRRLDRVFHDPKGPITGKVSVTATPTEIQGLVKGVYHAVIRLQNGQVTDCDCDCPDWFQSGGKAARIPCKHILATAVDAALCAPSAWPMAGAAPAAIPTVNPTPIPTPPATPERPSDPDTLTFNQPVRRAIGQAVAHLADLVEPILQADRTPFLIGPTDVAKTSAIRLVTVRHGWAFEALDGMSSFADADLVGLRTDHGVYASVIARAFQRARGGETVLLFLDELTRLNQRAMDVLMRPLLPIPAEIAWAQRVPADDGQTVRMVEVPMWGLDWAPVGRCKVALACNPWGSALDPALVRRTVPLEVGFDPAVAALFQKPARDAIETSWKLVTEGQLPLPIGYTLLAEATDPADMGFAPTYFAQLRAIDRPGRRGVPQAPGRHGHPRGRPAMNATLDIRAILDATANQILAVVAPDTARLVRAYVSLDEQADTAATDGVRIWVPPVFEGVDVAYDTPVAVGLLVHELGHFLQPLKALEVAEQEAAAPHWLGNIVADVQLEAMMAGLFPPLADTLVAVRVAVKTARLTEYTAAILKGRNLADVACSVALAGRFCRPVTPFDDSGESGSPLWGTLNRHGDPALTMRMTAFAWQVCKALSLAPDDLPEHVRQIMTEFPELRQAKAKHAIPGGGLTVVGAAGRAAQAEAAANTGAHAPAAAGRGPRPNRPRVGCACTSRWPAAQPRSSRRSGSTAGPRHWASSSRCAWPCRARSGPGPRWRSAWTSPAR